jgi:hypothetical protein
MAWDKNHKKGWITRRNRYGSTGTQLSTKKGENHGLWKGDSAFIGAKHAWVRDNKPKTRCEDCGCDSFELANISGRYLRDVDDYKWLCKRCHKQFDKDKIYSKFLKKKVRGNLIRCSRCGLFKLKSDFYRCKRHSLGIRSNCKKCDMLICLKRIPRVKDAKIRGNLVRCARCGLFKPKIQFYPREYSSLGITGYCRQCDSFAQQVSIR